MGRGHHRLRRHVPVTSCRGPRVPQPHRGRRGREAGGVPSKSAVRIGMHNADKKCIRYRQKSPSRLLQWNCVAFDPREVISRPRDVAFRPRGAALGSRYVALHPREDLKGQRVTPSRSRDVPRGAVVSSHGPDPCSRTRETSRKMKLCSLAPSRRDLAIALRSEYRKWFMHSAGAAKSGSGTGSSVLDWGHSCLTGTVG